MEHIRRVPGVRRRRKLDPTRMLSAGLYVGWGFCVVVPILVPDMDGEEEAVLVEEEGRFDGPITQAIVPENP